ncbi:hypothetical protein RO3G_13502 [Rhizopus delemar RA 99-880]|uniref:Uncharacterized protein n=1 Tax=Rhizopus delemar (strain RA 99-880 / ATCC MYA-4621 / FGSC 9543 / NRRL 43880) TaxID=246409 RepID=I1CK11_RHIO9|nr:hypothetical protein RO3G_13502 [Rhizopus delemar RA 99-880]|eukprot:EIE88791.1 hypothetical protein RO3G_13502 [Rhizopus delemar RA 99-880]
MDDALDGSIWPSPKVIRDPPPIVLAKGSKCVCCKTIVLSPSPFSAITLRSPWMSPAIKSRSLCRPIWKKKMMIMMSEIATYHIAALGPTDQSRKE